MRIDFVDVQQGDGALIETPAGRTITVDGGDNQLFARYLASRFRNTSDTDRQPIDAMVVSHGDADHFAGLTEIFESERIDQAEKRLFIHPWRVFHNGLVKRPSSVPEKDRLGATVKVGADTEAEQSLKADHAASRIDLRSDVFKVPHHGSAEFFADFLAGGPDLLGQAP